MKGQRQNLQFGVLGWCEGDQNRANILNKGRVQKLKSAKVSHPHKAGWGLHMQFFLEKGPPTCVNAFFTIFTIKLVIWLIL